MVQLNQEECHIPFPLSVVAAFHVARGSIAWAPVHNNPEDVRRHFVRFYRAIAVNRDLRLKTDPKQTRDV